jgi:hypothetical protein
MTEYALRLAQAIERMRDPSARFASLGMTRIFSAREFHFGFVE